MCVNLLMAEEFFSLEVVECGDDSGPVCVCVF